MHGQQNIKVYLSYKYFFPPKKRLSLCYKNNFNGRLSSCGECDRKIFLPIFIYGFVLTFTVVELETN